MWLTNLMAVPFSSLSYRGDVAWTRMEVSRMRTEGANDGRSQGWTDRAEDGHSQRWEGLGDAKSHGRTKVVTGGAEGWLKQEVDKPRSG